MEAARGLHHAGIGILMGASNVVRGGSHSGNIAAVDLANEGLLGILSSDDILSSLLMAALQLPQRVSAIDLASAVRTVTKTPPKRSVSTTAVKSSSANAPIYPACTSRAAFRSCAAFGAKDTRVA